MWRRLGPQFWLCVVWIVVLGIAGLFAAWLPIQDPAVSDYTALAAGPVGRRTGSAPTPSGATSSPGSCGARACRSRSACSPWRSGCASAGLLGLLAGYFRRRTEAVIMTVRRRHARLPGAGAAAVADRRSSARPCATSCIAIGIVTIPIFIRLARANTLTFAQREFVLAARATGARNRRIVIREVLPNVAMPLMAFSLVVVAVAIVAEGSLSFLGLSVPPTTPTWGNIIAAGRQDLAGGAAHRVLPVARDVHHRAGVQPRRRPPPRGARGQGEGAVSGDHDDHAPARRRRRPHLLPVVARASCGPSTGCRFTLEGGRTLGIVGESGSGKTVLSRSIMGLLPRKHTETPTGRVLFNGRDLRQAPSDAAAEDLGPATSPSCSRTR